MERRRDHARTDHAGRLAAAELQRLAAKPRGHQAHRQKVAREIDHVAQIVSIADAANRLVHHVGQVRRGQIERAAYADVEIAILGERREHHARLDDRLDQQEVRFFAELRDQRRLHRGIAPNRLVTDVQRRMRPRALRQILDAFADSFVSLDQNDVAFANVTLERGNVVRNVERVTLYRFGEQTDGPIAHPVQQPGNDPRFLAPSHE